MKVVKLSALRTGRLYPSGNIPGTHFYYRLSQPQGHSAAGRIMSMKNSNDTIGNRTRDLPACSAVSQPNSATACSPALLGRFQKLRKAIISFVVSFRSSGCPHGTTRVQLPGFSFNKNLRMSRNSVPKIQVSLKI